MKFNKTNAPLSRDLIQTTESRLGKKLPKELLQAYSDTSIEIQYPNKYGFLDTDKITGSIASIIPFDKLPMHYSIFFEDHQIQDLLPFARDDGGNLIVISLNEAASEFGSIYFYDTEFRTLNKIALSISNFIQKITPSPASELDPKDIEELIKKLSRAQT